mgnify:CR=1 FL=1
MSFVTVTLRPNGRDWTPRFAQSINDAKCIGCGRCYRVCGRDVLQLVPDTQVEPIERCSGHDGTYAVKSEFHLASMKIARPVVERVVASQCDHYGSDCPMAGHQIENGLKDGRAPEHPLSLLRKAYGI